MTDLINVSKLLFAGTGLVKLNTSPTSAIVDKVELKKYSTSCNPTTYRTPIYDEREVALDDLTREVEK